MMDINYTISRNIPVIAETDVVVVGGGPGGFSAALMAARSGAAVVLVERYGCLGGMASFGEVMPFMPNHANGTTLDRPAYVDWCRKMWEYLPGNLKENPYPGAGDFNIKDSLPDNEKINRFHKELIGDACKVLSKDVAMLAMEDLLLEAGVRIIYHHLLIDIIKDNGKIKSAIFTSKSGLAAVNAKIFIDSTGDGDLAALAGCPVEFGNEEGYCQPMTLCFKLAGIDLTRIPTRVEISALYHAARERGEIDCIRHNVLFYFTLDRDVIHFNTTRIIKKSGVNGLDLSDAEIDGRRQLREYLRFFRKNVPGFEQAKIHSIAHHVGVRESRRIRGHHYQTAEDFTKAAKYPDGIARVCYRIDLHNPQGTGTTLEYLPENEYYEISYRSIIPQNCDNLLMGCRAISLDQLLHSSARVMPPVCSIGQAAGKAAAICAKRKLNPIDLPGTELRQELIKSGANLA